MEQLRTICLNLTQDEFERLIGEKLGLVPTPVKFEISIPAHVPRDQKKLYQCAATPSVIRQIEGRYDIVPCPE